MSQFHHRARRFCTAALVSLVLAMGLPFIPAPGAAALTSTTTELESAADRAAPNETATFTATVLVPPDSAAPTGPVTFYDNPPSGQVAVAVATLDADGRAVFNTASLGWGDHRITAAYGGSASHAPSTSEVVPFVVSPSPHLAPTAAGNQHTLTVKEGGTVWGRGFNGSGQLGNGTTTDSSQVVQSSELSDVVSVSAGEAHSLALGAEGAVWAWGQNGAGQLGDGSTTNRLIPTQVPELDSIVGIAAGDSHSLAVRHDGTVLAWGENSFGQLGNGGTTSSSQPVVIPGLANVVAVAAGYDHSLALTYDGTVFAWGGVDAESVHEECGPSGVDGGESCWTVTVPPTTSAADSLTPVSVASLTRATAVAGGSRHAVALRSDGTVWAWGRNTEGQLGNGTTYDSTTPVQVSNLSGITKIGAGGGISMANNQATATTWTWGFGGNGQLGNGSFDNAPTPVQPELPTGGRIVELDAGQPHAVFLFEYDGQLYESGNHPAEGDSGSFQSASCGSGTYQSAGFCNPAALRDFLVITRPVLGAGLIVLFGTAVIVGSAANRCPGQPPGVIRYGDLVGKRATGGYGRPLTFAKLKEGTRVPKSIRPPGFVSGDSPYYHHRAHLVADMLGGDGRREDNVVMLFRTANLRMRGREIRVRNAVVNCELVDYDSVPNYGSSRPEPVSVTITARGHRGYRLGPEEIENRQ